MDKLKERIENHIGLWTAGVAVAAFIAGFNARNIIVALVSSSQQQARSTVTETKVPIKKITAIQEPPPYVTAISNLNREIVRLKQQNKNLKTACSTREIPAPPFQPKPATEASTASNRPMDGLLKLDAFCMSMFGSDFRGVSGETFKCSNGGKQYDIALSKACNWQFGSERYIIDPTSLAVYCDDSLRTAQPCMSNQRACDESYCCPD